MNAEVEQHMDAVRALCRQFGVKRLDVFGSATGSEFDPAISDVDFLVELEPPDRLSRFDAFFGLKEGLEELLGRHVDLVDPAALENPYFAATVQQSRRELYAA
ncbi:MAG: nucleotidyltransferase domain-containing protein [Microthrixaceae bacterium]